MLSNNPDYKEVFSHGDIRLYQPIGSYSTARYVAAGAQDVMSSCGITRDYLTTIAQQVLELCNDRSKDQVRTDVGVLMNNLLYRTKYPVDEDCAVRMGAIYCLLEDENPDTISQQIITDKVKLARTIPALYDFFLRVGEQSTPAWTDIELTLAPDEHHKQRAEILTTLIPQ